MILLTLIWLVDKLNDSILLILPTLFVCPKFLYFHSTKPFKTVI